MKKNLGLQARLSLALNEDGARNDLTTRAIPGPFHPVSARLLCKATGVFAGSSIIEPIFRLLDRRCRVRLLRKDGDSVHPGSVLARIRGPEPAILAGERLMLNLVSRLSGVATLTRRYVNAVKGTGAAILDTRKTTPLWRDLERDAVRAGGGVSHRFSLSDAVLVKDNHWRILRTRELAADRVYGDSAAVRKKSAFVAIEASDIRQVWAAIKARPDIILLDNMAENRIKEAVVMIRAARKAFGGQNPRIEASGGVTPASAKRLARLGVDRISVGALTHSAVALDMSLEVD